MARPSCIKIPNARQKLPVTDNIHNNDAHDQSNMNSELISIANEVFGYGKWSHSITSQTLDFVEHAMGKYCVGCATFIKVQLHDGTFHEDMGYGSTEKSSKSMAIFSARSASVTNALKKVLLCFGGKVEQRIKNLMIEKSTGIVLNLSTIGETQTFSKSKPLLPCAQSTPSKPTSPKSLEVNDHPTTNARHRRTPSPVDTGVDKENNEVQINTEMTEEEMRLERKRKQKLKQEEYKRKMKERELQSGEKPNPRY